MKTLFRIFVVLPIALVLLLFAVANRREVTVSFDPFSGGDIAGPAITAPLFIVLILTGVVGLLAGALVAWLRQRHWRREARLSRADADTARAEADRLRADLMATRVSTGASTGTALGADAAGRSVARVRAGTSSYGASKARLEE